MAGFEPQGGQLGWPCDACHAPCGWRPATCEYDPHDCDQPCEEVVAHEMGHLADRAFFCVMGFPPPRGQE